MTNAKWFTEVLMHQVLLEYLPLSSNAVDRCDNKMPIFGTIFQGQ